MTQNGRNNLPLYLTIFRKADQISDHSLIEMSLALAVFELCSLRDDCDDPWDCMLRDICPRSAKVRRWRTLGDQAYRIIGDDCHS